MISSVIVEERDYMICHWPMLREQLLQQWDKISPKELDAAGPRRKRIALLVQSKYGVAWQLVENYLKNFERTLPLVG